VVTSTYKARRDSLERLSREFPELGGRLGRLCSERVGGYRYMPRGLRLELVLRVRRAALDLGMTFASCREGFSDLNSPGVACDGSHLTSADRWEE